MKKNMPVLFFVFFLLVFSACTPAAAPTAIPSAAPTATPTETQAATTPTASPESEFVKAEGAGFTLGGKPFRFLGANSIYFGFYKQYGYSIEDAIRSARENNLSVLRIYLGFGDTTWGSRPIEEYDRALDTAAREGVRIIAVLTDCCCYGADWSSTREKYYGTAKFCEFSNPQARDDYKKYISTLLNRRNTVNGRIYKDDPTIMAWDILNEPTLQFTNDAEFKSWLADIAEYIKSIDANHLLTIGIDNSSSLYDSTGSQYDALNVPDLDFFSIHFNLPAQANMTSELPRLQFRVNTLLDMGKPVILEEFGIGTLRSFRKLDEREMSIYLYKYKSQMDLVFSAGGSGVMFWGWGVPETKDVPLWWQKEDHDITEVEFTNMLKNYRIPELGSVVLPTPKPLNPNDDFTSEKLDEERWKYSVSPGSSIRQENGRLALSVSDQEPAAGAGVQSLWSLPGDFDIQVNFEIGAGWTLPAHDHLDGAVLGVMISGQQYHIVRLRSASQDGIYLWNGAKSELIGDAPTQATSGVLRLVRKGEALIAYVDIGNGWQEVGQTVAGPGPAKVYMQMTSVNAGMAFTTYFDDFRVNSGDAVK